MPPEAQRFASFTSVQTRRAYENDIGAFVRFTDIQQPEEFRTVAGSYVLA